MKTLPTQFIWSDDSCLKFKNELTTPEIQHLITNFINCDYELCETGIDLAVSAIQDILLSAAKRSLKRKIIRRRHRISNSMNKKWFGKERRINRHAVRKLANSKRHDPMNADIRTTYHETLNECKTTS